MIFPSTRTASCSKGEKVAPKATSPVVDTALPIPFSAAGLGGESNDFPPFSLDGERYDQATYYGRFRKMLDVVDPRTLFCSQREIDDAVGLLKDFESSQMTSKQGCNNCKTAVDRRFDDAELWKAKKIKDAIFHPDTNEKLLPPFRMSGFLPFNAPVCVGALVASSTPSVFFFHVVNQTHNALINYNNRNATQPQEMSAVFRGYVGAVASSVGIAMGLKHAIANSKSLSAAQKLKYQRFSALPAIVSAAAINVFLMRAGELSTGIDVYYEQDTPQSQSTDLASTAKSNEDSLHPVVVGSSQLAARKSMTEMVVSRMVLPLPVFLMVPIAMSGLDPLLKKNPRLSLPVQSFFVLLGFGLGLPATIALFPQIGTVEASSLEEKFQNLKNSRGNPVTVFKYNKGL